MLRIANHHVSKITFILLLFEFAIALGAVYLGAMIRMLDHHYPSYVSIDNFFLTAVTFALTVVFSLSALGMYQINFREGIRATFLRLMPAFALALTLITLIFYVIPALYLGRGIMGLVFVITAAGVLVGRILFFKTSEIRLLKSRIIFLGTGKLAQECHELALTNTAHHEYHILGFVPVSDEEQVVLGKYVLPTSIGIAELAKQYSADEVVVAVQNRRGVHFPIQELLDCKLMGVKVIDAAAFFEREACQIRVESLQPGWLVFGDGFNQSFSRKFGTQVATRMKIQSIKF